MTVFGFKHTFIGHLGDCWVRLLRKIGTPHLPLMRQMIGGIKAEAQTVWDV